MNADAALLLNIASRPAATLAALQSVVANRNVNAAGLTAITHHANTDADLLALVARHPITIAEAERVRIEEAQRVAVEEAERIRVEEMHEHQELRRLANEAAAEMRRLVDDRREHPAFMTLLHRQLQDTIRAIRPMIAVPQTEQQLLENAGSVLAMIDLSLGQRTNLIAAIESLPQGARERIGKILLSHGINPLGCPAMEVRGRPGKKLL